jgi:hypothetical protein
MKMLRAFAYLTSLANLFLYLYYYYLTSRKGDSAHERLIDEQTSFAVNSPELVVVTKSSSPDRCDVIQKTAQQYEIELDGIVYPQYVPETVNVSIDYACLSRRSNKTKIILYWNRFFVDYVYGVGRIQPFVDRNCPITNCELINDTSRLAEADLVFMHGMSGTVHLPKGYTRGKNQRFAFINYEPATVIPGGYMPLDPFFNNGFFDLTHSYLSNSDFANAYENLLGFVWKLNETFDEHFDYFSTKRKLAFAVISNCNDYSRRMEYVTEMSLHMPVDVYGECGKSKCPLGLNRTDTFKCHDLLSN